MVEAIFGALMNIFSWPAIGFMFLAAAIAISIGVIPGLGGYFLLACLIPFVFRMEPVSALIFLMTGHGVVETGGAVTAILFNTPGTGQNIATTFDGYAMTQKGEGGRAVGAALTASALGGMVGGLIYILLLPLVRPIILSLGSGDFFVLIALGVVCIGALLGKEPVKGLMMGALGFAMSTVGQDPVVGTIRFDFGLMYLWDGVPLIAVVIGLVAVSEMVSLSARGGTVAQIPVESEQISKRIGKDMILGVFDVLRRWWLMLRCSILGFIVGFIPGLGGQAAAFMSYGYGAKVSKDPESFGKGNIEGVIAPESSNNAQNGGSLLPTLAFGVPGSGGFAVILGVMMMMGVIPGTSMFKEHLPLTITLGWALAIGNVVAAIIAFFTVRPLIRLTFVRASLLIAPILVVAVIGGYVATYSFGDIIVIFVFTILGICMKKFKYPVAPLILGLVLGELAEVNLNVALQAYGPAFLVIRPITAMLTITVLFMGTWPFLKKLRKNRDRR